MTVEIRVSLSIIAAAVMLVACASKGPASPKSAGTDDETSAEYQRLADNAGERRVCKRQAVLGTRVDSIVCVTEAEMKAQRENAADILRDIQVNATMNPQATPAPPPPPISPSR
jgi:hypothetical protein